MVLKEFDPVIYPIKLVISVGVDINDIFERFDSREPFGWGDKSEYDNYGSWVTRVIDREDEKRKILWYLPDKESITFNYVCHETFHIATTLCRDCNMNMGLEIGQDEHPAYIAGWAGKCIENVLMELNNEEM